MRSIRSRISRKPKPLQNGGANHVIKSNGSIGQHHNSNGVGHHVRFKDNNKFEECNGHSYSVDTYDHDDKSVHIPNGVLKHSKSDISDEVRISALETERKTSGNSELPVISEENAGGSLSRNHSFVREGPQEVIPADLRTVPEEKERINISPTPGTSTGTLFRDTVRRHFTSKDKFFNLVTTLLNSVQEEKRAHLDLISSFETARQIKVEVYEPPSSVPRRAKHRRKQAAIPLAVKIQQNRERQQLSNEIEIPDNTRTDSEQNKTKEADTNGEIIEKDKVNNITNSDHPEPDNNNRKENINNDTPGITNGPSLEKLFPKSYNTRTENTLTVTADVEESRDSNDDKDSDDLINKSSDEREEYSDSGITKDVNTNEIGSEREQVDKLVLESVLSNNDTSDESAETSLDNNKDTLKTTKVPVIEVETDSDSCSDSDYCDNNVSEAGPDVNDTTIQQDTDIYCDYSQACVIDLGGTHSDMSSSDEEDLCGRVEIEDLGDDGSDNEIHTLNQKMANISTIEYERKPKRRIRPQLDPISEAESSKTSFNTLTSKSNESSDLLEVQYNIESDDDDHIDSKDKHRENDVVSPRVLKETRNSNRESQLNIQNGTSSPINHKQTKDKKNTKANDTKSRSKKSENKLSLDLINVYSENKDLQRVEKREVTNKPRKQTCKKSHRAKSGKSRAEHKKVLSAYENHRHLEPSCTQPMKIVQHKHGLKETVYLPLEPTRNTRSPRAVSCTSTRSAPDLHRRTDIVDFYRSFQSQRDLYRYRKPENILWDRIDVSERCVSAVEKYGDQSGDNNNDRTNSSGKLGREQDESNTLRSWDMPLTEAVKRVKSARNLPPAPDLNETTPRHVRVQQMYSQLKRMRRGSGYTTCKPLISLTRRPNDFRF